MRDEKVVFILGAGASHTYGYPLGKELRYRIVKRYPNVLNELTRSLKKSTIINNYSSFNSSSSEFITKFSLSADLSIDLFLSKFPGFAFEGKMAIMYLILEAEKASVFLEDLANRIKMLKKDGNIIDEADDWIWHLYDKLTRRFNSPQKYSEINFDNISFVTFNYDRSLEYFLYTALENGFNYKQIGGSPKELFDRIKIEHVYGKVIELPWERKEGKTALGYRGFNVNTTQISEWVKNIRIIYDNRKKDLENIHTVIRDANKIYFLGFGYDITNLKLLGFPEILSSDQIIYGTGYGLYEEEIGNIVNFFLKAKISSKPLILNSNCTDLLRRYYFTE